MQEVTIKPRGIFKHMVTVEQPFKELCWNFCTRRKNISFGLFRISSKAKASSSNSNYYGGGPNSSNTISGNNSNMPSDSMGGAGGSLDTSNAHGQTTTSPQPGRASLGASSSSSNHIGPGQANTTMASNSNNLRFHINTQIPPLTQTGGASPRRTTISTGTIVYPNSPATVATFNASSVTSTRSTTTAFSNQPRSSATAICSPISSVSTANIAAFTASNNSTASNTTHPSGNAHATNSYNTGGLAFAINTSDTSLHPHIIHHTYTTPYALNSQPPRQQNVPVITTDAISTSLGDMASPSTPVAISAAHRDGSSSSLHSMDNGPSGTNKKSQRPRLEDPDLEEIIQIAHYESSKVTIKGSYYIQEPGTYILVFDNRFSVNTSKKLFFFVGLTDVEPTSMVVKKEVEGWMLKKGNRKIQGYQRRWVEVDSSGSLSYYKSPGNPSRGIISLSTAAIRLDHDHLLIDIDSGQSIFHFKVETAQEFERWTGCIEKFVAPRSMQLTEAGMIFQSESTNLFNATGHSLQNSASADPEIEMVHYQVKMILSTLKEELCRMRDLIETSKPRADTKHQSKEFAGILGSISEMATGLITYATTTESQLHAFHSSFHSRIQGQRERSVTAIQQAEAAFYACLNDNNHVRRKFGLDAVTTSTFLPNGVFMSTDRERMGSITSTFKDEVFFDAEEGDSDDSYRSYSEESRRASYDGLGAVTSPLALLRLDTSVEDARLQLSEIALALDAAESEPALMMTKQAMTSSSSTDRVDSVANLTAHVDHSSRAVQRRTTLPAVACSMQNVSIMSILRNNVGKDLSTVTMPIVLNEPISLLQKLCEELEYSELLNEAARTDDPIERLCFIAGFIVSGYSSTVHRAARKPFNPLLGETFEFVRPDRGFKFISEKVSHHPPVMACYAESKDYRIYQDSLLKTKFWGKSMELNNTGTVHLELPTLRDEYVWNKVTTSMRNLFAPGRYLEHHGVMKITSITTGHYCELTFKESGYFTSANNEVVGAVFTPRGQKAISLCGRWDHSFNKFLDSAPDKLQVIWRASPFPPNHADNYGFTQFAVELNEMSSDVVGLLPNTDVRFRPDQRLYEEGKAEKAELEKLRLEQKQRETRRLMEAEGLEWTPQWFEVRKDEHSEGGRAWRYKGDYFESRGKFDNPMDLFS
ncbi:hypothetical protein BASA50_002955 [Batrachochytrium salamandrivorans]|uniref:PH domain-containing protein n=1 Tax=Batrachochytrium salamandrivorans TaxID=1357716 RepID=A0ABQ8FK05_9FUNG|nr:hypothetical protein BASA50_002955 [Batrachochytrium salamandrivorans]